MAPIMLHKLNFPNPKTLFFWDGLGALVSFILLYFVLGKFMNFFGMPEEAVQILYYIAGLCFLLSSFSCILSGKRWRIFLLFVILANSIYLLISFYFLVEHFFILKIPGILYFGAEKLIIISLVYLEMRFLKGKYSC